MKVSLNWLREMVDVELDAEVLAETLTRGGIEVGGVEDLGAEIEKVVVGRIETMERHPNADKLWVCRVDAGNETKTIVTGAQNLQAGDKVPVAQPGTTLPNGLLIQVSELRGIKSEGMLCSTEELGLDESLGGERSKDGIFILPVDALVGESLDQMLGRQDWVLDLELYPNRPDCLAMVNVAREVAALTNKAAHVPLWAEFPGGQPNETLPVPMTTEVPVVIEDGDLCSRYAGLLVEDVKIGPSPAWMQRKLLAAGVRPINNVVDITNYCMIELGQPLHAFDRDKVTGAVHVRRAYSGETLKTLDKVDRLLDREMLLIADEQVPLGLAGVMGGLDSEVTTETKRLFIESAHFNGVSIRRTSRRLGLRSEASNRFEKGVNPYGVLAALGRVAELIVELKVGHPVGFIDQKGELPPLRSITLSPQTTSAVLGMEVSPEQIRQVLKRLDFSCEGKNESFEVEIPSFRSDLHCQEDLIEEVARLVGYDKIPTTLPQGSTTQGKRTPEQQMRRRLKQMLSRAGMNEVVSYAFTNGEKDRRWSQKEGIPLLNPLREELGVMRTTLVPSLVEIAQRNIARRNLDVAIFEIGSVYLAQALPLAQLPKEDLHLAGLAVGKPKKHWLKPSLEYDFYYLKGILEGVGEELGLTFSFHEPEGITEESRPLLELLHPGRSAQVYAGKTPVGYLGEIHPAMQKEWDLERAVVFELDLRLLLELASDTILAQSIPRFPGANRDLAVVVERHVPAAAVRDRIEDLGGKLLLSVDLFDVYSGKPIPEDRKSLAFKLHYQSYDRTLTDEEINGLNSRILNGIQQEFSAERRK